METRVARCMMIARVLAADGMFTDDERGFLNLAMDSQGLNEGEREQVRNFEDWQLAEPIVTTLTVGEKRELMDGLVSAALSDGKISPLEMQMIERLSKALGLV